MKEQSFARHTHRAEQSGLSAAWGIAARVRLCLRLQKRMWRFFFLFVRSATHSFGIGGGVYGCRVAEAELLKKDRVVSRVMRKFALVSGRNLLQGAA